MKREHFPIRTELSADKLSPAEEKTFELLKERYEGLAIDMEEFERVPGYGKERVQGDKERMARKIREIKKAGTEPTRKARLLETLLVDQIELSNWFGQNTFTIVPTKFDDLFHGVDLALEIENESEVKHLALGIDVTSSPISIRKKLKIIKDHIKDGTLTAIEYFHSENHNPDFYGTMNNIPQVVIGTDSKTTRELGELWMSGYGLAKLRKKSGQPPLSPEAEESQRDRAREARAKLEKHRAQLLLLEEIKIQLTAFKKFAEQEGQTQVANKLASALDLINTILKEKDVPDIEDIFRNNEDLVFQSLSEAVNDFDNL